MKKATFTVSLLLMSALLCHSQVPQKFKYQAVVRDMQQGLVENQDVSFRMSILEGSASGSPVYVETHMVATNTFGLADLVIGEGSAISGTFADIPWGEDLFFLKVEVDPAGGSAYEHIGTSQLISVPFSLYSGNLSSPTRKFTIQEDEGHPVDSALFEVRNAEGQTVFAVYPEGTRIYILDEEAKGRKGGFAVGGYSRTTKGITQEYMRVTPDSVRIYFKEPVIKGKKGGFAVGGYTRSSKGPADHYFMLKPDSAKFTLFTDQESGKSNLLSVVTKPKNGEPDGESGLNLFNLSRNNYFIGHRTGESITDGSDNTFIGFESGINATTCYGNLFLGYQSGYHTTTGGYNAFIGHNAGFMNEDGFHNVNLGFGAGKEGVHGYNNVYIGTDAGVKAQGGDNVYIGAAAGSNNNYGRHNIMIGSAAGSNADSSMYNIFIGSTSGFQNINGEENIFIGHDAGFKNTSGSYNTFIGPGAGQNHQNGNENIFLGAVAGFENSEGNANMILGMGAGYHHISGSENVFLGRSAGEWNETGANNVLIGTRAGWNNLGRDNVIIGFEAGAHSQGNNNIFIGNSAGIFSLGSDILMIDNSPADSTESLIWGKFDQDILRINNRLGIGRYPEVGALEVQGDAYKTGGGTWEVTSDARVKTDIETIEGGLEKIMQLRPVKFRYSDEWRNSNPGIEDRQYYHFIAQEFAEVFPGSVHEGPEALENDPDKLLRLDSQPAQVVAIRAIQELAEQNRLQQTMLEQLQEENQALRQMYQNILSLLESE